MGDFRDDTQFYFSLAGNIIVVQIKVEGFRDVDGHPRQHKLRHQDSDSQNKMAFPKVNLPDV